MFVFPVTPRIGGVGVVVPLDVVVVRGVVTTRYGLLKVDNLKVYKEKTMLNSLYLFKIIYFKEGIPRMRNYSD